MFTSDDKRELKEGGREGGCRRAIKRPYCRCEGRGSCWNVSALIAERKNLAPDNSWKSLLPQQATYWDSKSWGDRVRTGVPVKNSVERTLVPFRVGEREERMSAEANLASYGPPRTGVCGQGDASGMLPRTKVERVRSVFALVPRCGAGHPSSLLLLRRGFYI